MIDDIKSWKIHHKRFYLEDVVTINSDELYLAIHYVIKNVNSGLKRYLIQNSGFYFEEVPNYYLGR